MQPARALLVREVSDYYLFYLAVLFIERALIGSCAAITPTTHQRMQLENSGTISDAVVPQGAVCATQYGAAVNQAPSQVQILRFFKLL